jgi:hypothetical protein
MAGAAGRPKTLTESRCAPGPREAAPGLKQIDAGHVTEESKGFGVACCEHAMAHLFERRFRIFSHALIVFDQQYRFFRPSA